MKKRGGMIWFALLAKSAKLVKLFKVLKFGKVFLTAATMLLSVFVYSFALGPWFSVGFVILLFVHEMGHVIALKYKGLPASAPVFIPMVGAVVFSPKFESEEDEALVGFGGPLLGSLGALACFAIWKMTPGSPTILLMLSYTATFLNLFNLIPIRPLDGGRVTQIVGSWFKYVGIAALLLFSMSIKQPFVLLLWILVLDDIGMNKFLKFGIAVVCMVSMTVLMSLGLGDQPWWANVLDCVLATIFVLGYYFQAFVEENTDESQPSEIAKPVAQAVRLKWFAYYAVLLVSLVAFMAYQVPFLPVHK